MATLASLLLRLGIDRGAFGAGLRAGQQDASQFASDVSRSMSRAADATQMASSRIIQSASSAQAGILGMAQQTQQTGQIITDINAGVARSTGPVVTAQQAAAEAMRQASAAAGPLVAGIRGANGALAMAGPIAGRAAMGIGAVGGAAAGAGPPMARAGGAAGGLAGSLGGIPGPANRATAALRQVGNAALFSAERGSFMSRVLSMAFAFSGGVAVTNVFGFLGNALLGFNSRLEQANIAFETLLGNAENAGNFIERMLRFAEVTPFEFTGLVDAVQRLIALGFAADEALPILRRVGDAVAALGGTTEHIDRITLALGQMRTAGRVNAQDMRQLTEANIPAWQFLAEAIGKSVQETRDLAERGLIPADVAIQSILDGMARWEGMMARQARTAQGAFSTIRDAALETISSAVDPLFRALSEGTVAIADFFIGGGGRYVIPVIHAIGFALAYGLIPRLYGAALAVNALTIGTGALTARFIPLVIAISTLGIIWNESIGGMRNSLGPAVSGLMEFVGALGGAIAGSGLLIPLIEALALIITGRFVASLVMSAGAALANIILFNALNAAIAGLTVTTTTAAVGVTGLAGALAALGRIGGAIGLLLGGVVIAAIAAIIAAVALLLLNFDRVAQGFRVLEYHAINAIKGIVEAAASIPIVGEMFKGLADGLQDALNQLITDMTLAEAEINRKAAEMGGTEVDPLADLQAQLKLGADTVIGQVEDLVERFGTSLEGVRTASRQSGGAAMQEMAEGIREAQSAPLEALRTLGEMVRAQLDPQVEIARLFGMLHHANIAAGMQSGDPAVVAQTEATIKLITERLDVLTEGAYSKGLNAGRALADGVEDGYLSESARAQAFMDAFDPTPPWERFRPAADAVRRAMEDVNKELERTSQKSSALSSLSTAFSEIRSAAHRYFDALHQRNLQAIDDARRQKNAILDAKAALIQSPVTEAQKALDFQRRKIEEFRLREAVREASDPKAQRDAILALQDFLAQTHIDDMQAQVDAATDRIDQQKEANDAVAEAQRIAEDRRHEFQQESFDRQLELLQRELAKHPQEWQTTQDQIIALLEGYGITYKDAGSLLTSMFVDGLKENVLAAYEAMRLYADLIPGYHVQTPLPDTSPTVRPTNRALPFQGGAWHILEDNLLALLHKDEMVPPANIASLLREVGSRPMSPTTITPVAGGSSDVVTRTLGDIGGRGGGTIILQVGEEKLAEWTDQQLYVQDTVYGERHLPSTGSLR